MKTFRFDDLPEFCQWVLTHANVKQLQEALSEERDDMSIEVFINGVDSKIDFEHMFTEIDSQLERLVEEKAKAIVADRYIESSDEALDIARRLGDIKNELFD